MARHRSFGSEFNRQIAKGVFSMAGQSCMSWRAGIVSRAI